MTGDYRTRSYLSSGEAAKYLGISVSLLHELVRQDRVR
ncbi:MAG TPA: site-specific DNA-methyltransferase, partial [Candidatus Syntrophoarchaeum butanivorans]|nr:site-specific DNA-methyltransferase [Candidatus Syntrophoarchaeum butanivorans]